MPPSKIDIFFHGSFPLAPIQRPHPPEVDQSGHQDAYEDQHLQIPGPPCLTNGNSPGIDKNSLEIENYKEHSHKVELDIKTDSCRAGRHNARLVGLAGHPLSVFLTQYGRHTEHRCYENDNSTQVYDKRPERKSIC